MFFQTRDAIRICHLGIFVSTIIAVYGCGFGSSHAFTAYADDKIGVVSDTHISVASSGTYANSISQCQEAFAWVSRRNPSLVINVGDVSTSGELSQCLKYRNIYKTYFGNTPGVHVMGNHDSAASGMYNDLSKAQLISNFKKATLNDELTFRETGEANVIGLGRCYWSLPDPKKDYDLLSQKDAKWLNSCLLKTARAGKWAVVVCHYPLDSGYWGHKDARTRFEEVVGSFPNVIYLYGHMHHFPDGTTFRSYTMDTNRKNPYAKSREGYPGKSSDKQKRYPLKTVAVWSTLNNRAGGMLTASGSNISYNSYVPKFGKNISNSLDKTIGSITLAPSAEGGNMTANFKVSFSDKKRHGNVSNGGIVKVKSGKSKKIDGIPAGVLVTIEPVSKNGWSTPKAKKVEAYGANRTLKVKFVKTYKIKYSGNGATGGNNMDPSEIKLGAKAHLKRNTYKREGYSFAGWSKSKNGKADYANGAAVKNLAGKKNNVILYAVWNPNKYSIKFNGNGATSGKMAKISAQYGSKIKLPANSFKRTGYDFKGWSTSRSGTVQYSDAKTVRNLATSGTRTLYAVWKKSPVSNPTPSTPTTSDSALPSTANANMGADGMQNGETDGNAPGTMQDRAAFDDAGASNALEQPYTQEARRAPTGGDILTANASNKSTTSSTDIVSLEACTFTAADGAAITPGAFFSCQIAGAAAGDIANPIAKIVDPTGRELQNDEFICQLKNNVVGSTGCATLIGIDAKGYCGRVQFVFRLASPYAGTGPSAAGQGADAPAVMEGPEDGAALSHVDSTAPGSDAWDDQSSYAEDTYWDARSVDVAFVDE